MEQWAVLATRWQQRDPERRKVTVVGGAVLCSYTHDLMGFVVSNERTVAALDAAVKAAKTQ